MGAAEALVGRVVAGRYRITGVLGSGGMGVVYAALQQPLGREVALKVLRPGIVDEAFVKRFEREAQATSKVTHPRLVVVYDYGVDEHLPFLVMEKLAGRTLRDEMKARGRIPAAEALAFVRDAAEGLAAAHEAGVIHRDLKPENVFLVAPRNEVKLLDFGIAKIAGADGTAEGTQTATGTVAGTPGYVAPERFSAGISDARADLYSLGVMLFELVAGRLPFDASTPMALAVAAMHETAPLLSRFAPEIAPEVDVVVASLLARDPALRPANARAVVEMIDALRRATPAPSWAPPVAQAVLPAAPVGQASLPALSAAPRVDDAAAPGQAQGQARRPAPLALVVGAAAAIAVAVFAAASFMKREVPAVAASEATCATDASRCLDEGARALGEKNHGAAAKAWRAGCDANVGDACVALAQAIRTKALEGDELDVNVLLSRACDGRAASGCLALGRLLEEEGKRERAQVAYARSCKLGAADACVHTLAVVDVGSGELPASDEALAALTADCATGEAAACRALGLARYRRATVAGDDAGKAAAGAPLVRACHLGLDCARAHDPTTALLGSDTGLAAIFVRVPVQACFPQGAVAGSDYVWMRFDIDARGRATDIVARVQGRLGATEGIAACAKAALEKTHLVGGPLAGIEHVFF